MFNIAGIDLLEQELLDYEHTLLEILLQDKTTEKTSFEQLMITWNWESNMASKKKFCRNSSQAIGTV